MTPQDIATWTDHLRDERGLTNLFEAWKKDAEVSAKTVRDFLDFGPSIAPVVGSTFPGGTTFR